MLAAAFPAHVEVFPLPEPILAPNQPVASKSEEMRTLLAPILSDGDSPALQQIKSRVPLIMMCVLAVLIVLALLTSNFLRHKPTDVEKQPSASNKFVPSLESSQSSEAVPTATEPVARPLHAESVGDAPLAPLEVTLDFSRECWVDALIDGKKRIAEQRVAGEALRLPAQQKVLITLGDPGAVEVQVNGAPLLLPVTPKGVPLVNFPIDLDTLKILSAKKNAH